MSIPPPYGQRRHFYAGHANSAPEPTDSYLCSFQWNKVRYRAEKPLGELIENLHKEIQNIDNDVKAKFNQYNTVKTNLAALQRKQTYVPNGCPVSRFYLARH